MFCTLFSMFFPPEAFLYFNFTYLEVRTIIMPNKLPRFMIISICLGFQWRLHSFGHHAKLTKWRKIEGLMLSVSVLFWFLKLHASIQFVPNHETKRYLVPNNWVNLLFWFFFVVTRALFILVWIFFYTLHLLSPTMPREWSAYFTSAQKSYNVTHQRACFKMIRNNGCSMIEY